MSTVTPRQGILCSIDLCECGHPIHDHQLGFGSILAVVLIEYFHHKCDYCMCQDYKYEVTHNFNFDGTDTFRIDQGKLEDIYKAQGKSEKSLWLGIGLVMLATHIAMSELAKLVLP